MASPGNAKTQKDRQSRAGDTEHGNRDRGILRIGRRADDARGAAHDDQRETAP